MVPTLAKSAQGWGTHSDADLKPKGWATRETVLGAIAPGVRLQVDSARA